MVIGLLPVNLTEQLARTGLNNWRGQGCPLSSPSNSLELAARGARQEETSSERIETDYELAETGYGCHPRTSP